MSFLAQFSTQQMQLSSPEVQSSSRDLASLKRPPTRSETNCFEIILGFSVRPGSGLRAHSKWSSGLHPGLASIVRHKSMTFRNDSFAEITQFTRIIPRKSLSRLETVRVPNQSKIANHISQGTSSWYEKNCVRRSALCSWSLRLSVSFQRAVPSGSLIFFEETWEPGKDRSSGTVSHRRKGPTPSRTSCLPLYPNRPATTHKPSLGHFRPESPEESGQNLAGPQPHEAQAAWKTCEPFRDVLDLFSGRQPGRPRNSWMQLGPLGPRRSVVPCPFSGCAWAALHSECALFESNLFAPEEWSCVVFMGEDMMARERLGQVSSPRAQKRMGMSRAVANTLGPGRLGLLILKPVGQMSPSNQFWCFLWCIFCSNLYFQSGLARRNFGKRKWPKTENMRMTGFSVTV